jgi:Ferritin-like domain
MKVATCIAATLALASSAAAGPIKKRQAYTYTDADILNYALTLEHLEDKFYREGLANFTQADFAKHGYDETFYQNLKEISYDETTHVTFLTAALQGTSICPKPKSPVILVLTGYPTAAGAMPVKECTYSFGVTDVPSFMATASILEGVGVTAYLGAAANITSKAYLTAAGQILTIEARHNAYLRSVMKQRPAPQTFDVPQDFNEVYSLASPMIVSCPADNPKFLPLKAFPALTVTSKDSPKTGDKITVSAKVDGSVYAGFVGSTGLVSAPIQPCGDGKYTVTIPAGVHGQSYLLLTKDAKKATDDTILAGPAIVMIAGTDGVPASA